MSPNMNVIFIARHLDAKMSIPGGPARVNVELKEALAKKRPEYFEFFDPKHDKISLARRVLDLRSSDTVCHFGDQSPWSFFMALLVVVLRVPFTMTMHGSAQYEAKFSQRQPWSAQIQQRLMMNFADRVALVSPHMLSLLPTRIRSKTHSIPNGCSLITGSSDEKVCIDLRSKSRLCVVTVGGTKTVKGILFLLKALELLRQPKEIVLTIYGGKGDDHAQVIDRNWQTRVDFHGVVPHDELLLAFKAHDVFVQGSFYEPFGLAPLEALLSATPVVLTEECGLSSYLLGFKKHYPWAVRTVPYDDTEAMAEAIASAYQMRRDTTSNRKCFYVSSLRHLSWPAIAEEYLKLWRAVTSR